MDGQADGEVGWGAVCRFGGLLPPGTRVSVWENKVLEMDGGDGWV